MSNQPDFFHGAFNFKPADHGILHGTYLNNDTPMPHPESAFRQENGDRDFRDFSGIYRTIWIEPGNEKVSARLEIKPHHTGIPHVYELTWTAIDPQPRHGYQGLGMLQGTDLVGCYWKTTV
ncbi:MAG: hypothetical protein EOO15_18145 [Chitinophagaceae bacterium]|nr:MAG: hypothetical protein EOO15_18145 [Chitinophagaceae bacterium]